MQNDVNALFLILGLVSLVVGAVGIANVTLVTVMERVAEIGLRRSSEPRAGTSPPSSCWSRRSPG
ncbi:ABC transporter permease [Nonomuraea recticatena]|uniref:ABC transporter permease n=1 Tax=Nonomuraea recticatena TaxID=46178 RepID=UPI00361F4AB4